MTTITIPRALLVQALNAIQLPCDRWNGVQSKIVKAAADAVQAELAKPDADKGKTGWPPGMLHDDDKNLSRWLSQRGNAGQLAAQAAHEAELAKPSAPAWHDEPTEPGIWLCDEGGPDCYTYTTHNIVLLNDPALKDDECRWYGPIPQDTKAEGEST